MGVLRDTPFALGKYTVQQNKGCGIEKICTDMFGTVEIWIAVSCQTFCLEM